MKVVLQRVREASVRVDGEAIAEIGPGLLILIGVAHGDTAEHAQALAKQVSALRLFEDAQGKMNRSVADVHGELLVVSQFTLVADLSKGTRPSFDPAAPPEHASALIAVFAETLRQTGLSVREGRFGARMDVALVNDGPVTCVLETN